MRAGGDPPQGVCNTCEALRLQYIYLEHPGEPGGVAGSSRSVAQWRATARGTMPHRLHSADGTVAPMCAGAPWSAVTAVAIACRPLPSEFPSPVATVAALVAMIAIRQQHTLTSTGSMVNCGKFRGESRQQW